MTKFIKMHGLGNDFIFFDELVALSPEQVAALCNRHTGVGADGAYVFENLAYGTYYICQDVQDGWFQTQLNDAGTTGVDPGDVVIGEPLDLSDDLVNEFCYEVVLTSENRTSNENDFGNESTVLGLVDDRTTTTNEDETGDVLGATDVLANTGDPVYAPTIFGIVSLAMAVMLTGATIQKKSE